MAKNWAICIGVNHYDFNIPLECAVNDAKQMSEFFRRINFDKIYLFTDDSPPIPDMSRNFPSKPLSNKVSGWLGKRFKKGNTPPLNISDNLWFFFSGHGSRHKGQDYLLLSDSNSDIEKSAIAISDITHYLRQSGAGNIIMLIDACRSSAKGESLELEKEQGIIKISSCQPNQRSYEVKPLNHGAFTYALLEALQFQGEGNCATLERLCNRLRSRVKEISWQYNKKTQIPYAAVEPETKYHLILLPDYILPSQADLSRLREEALKAEIKGDLKLAENMWTRLVKFDTEEALQSLYRIRDRLKTQPSSKPTPEETPSTTGDSKSVATHNFKLPSISVPALPINIIRINRRQLLKGFGWGSLAGGTLGVITILNKLFSSKSLPTENNKPISTSNTKPLPSVKTEIKGDSTYQFQVVTVNSKGEEINRETKQAKYFTEDLGNGVTLDMVSIPGGTFKMGTDEEEIERLVKQFNREGFRREKPQHEVTLQPFFMGKFLVTQAQWKAIANRSDLKFKFDLKSNPSYFKGDDHLPVERVNWNHAVEFCARLSRLTKRNYLLPSEAQWEYACRVGTTTPFSFGETITTDLANYNGNKTFAEESKGVYRKKTTVVGTFPPNAFGLYDMHGNLWEWCADPWHDNYHNAPNDGRVWDEKDNDNRYQNYQENFKKLLEDSSNRVIRGGSWYYYPDICRSAYRNINYARGYVSNEGGFRVVCVVG